LDANGQGITMGAMYNVTRANIRAGLAAAVNPVNSPMFTAGVAAGGGGNPPAIPAYFSSSNRAVFCLPIYSGIIGVLMPDKKLLPLSLLPLEVELTVNPYGVYAAGAATSRQFTITKCEIFSHTLFFEQELHRSLEAIVAETGIFLHYQSFYLGPVNTYNALQGAIGGYNHIGVYLKSI